MPRFQVMPTAFLKFAEIVPPLNFGLNRVAVKDISIYSVGSIERLPKPKVILKRVYTNVELVFTIIVGSRYANIRQIAGEIVGGSIVENQRHEGII